MVDARWPSGGSWRMGTRRINFTGVRCLRSRRASRWMRRWAPLHTGCPQRVAPRPAICRGFETWVRLVCPMSSGTDPLSDGEYDALADLLQAHGVLDIEALLGLLNAVAVAPGLVPASTWVPHVFPPERCAGLGESHLRSVVGALLRLYNEINTALADDTVFAPDTEDIDDCMSFAAGYAAGAALDPVWRGNADHWTFRVAARLPRRATRSRAGWRAQEPRRRPGRQGARSPGHARHHSSCPRRIRKVPASR